MDFNEIKSILQILVPLIGAAWFLYIYFKEGLHRPKIEFDISCKMTGRTESNRIVEFQITANNKGKVKFTFPELRLRIRAIEDPNTLGFLKNTHRLKFPLKVFEENIIPENYMYYFVEPGTKQTFTYTTKIASSIDFIVAFAAFKYKQRVKWKFAPFRIVREQHTCERTFYLAETS